MVALLIATFIAGDSLTQILSQILGPLTVAAATAAVWFGLAARRHGEERGVLPAGIGAVVGGFLLLMLMLSLVVHVGFGWE